MSLSVLLVAAALAAAPAPPPTAPTAPTASQNRIDPAALDAALKVARILHTEESQGAMTLKMIDESIAPAFRKDESFIALESDYPGIIDVVVTEMRPLLLRAVRSDLPDYQARVAALLASRLSAAELEDLGSFYQSPTGQKLISGMKDNYRADAMIEEVIADPDRPTSTGAFAKDHSNAVSQTVKLIDASDTEALISLAQKPYAGRLQALGAEMRKLDQQFANEPDEELDAEIEAAITAAMERHMAKIEAERAPAD